MMMMRNSIVLSNADGMGERDTLALGFVVIVEVAVREGVGLCDGVRVCEGVAFEIVDVGVCEEVPVDVPVGVPVPVGVGEEDAEGGSPRCVTDSPIVALHAVMLVSTEADPPPSQHTTCRVCSAAAQKKVPPAEVRKL